MKPAHLGRVVAGFLFASQIAASQILVYPYLERFDTTADSSLPVGWETTTHRRPGGDFFASASSPRSSPHCVLAQNSLVAQSLTSPTFDFTNRTPDKLRFAVARSSTHRSGVLVVASVDGGLTYPTNLSDTLRNPGTSGYTVITLRLPISLANNQNVRIRWQVLGDSGSSSGTLRIDDVEVTTAVSSDLALTNIEFSPPLATSQDSLVIKATVKNVGLQSATGYRVQFFFDLDNDSIPDFDERFDMVAGPALAVSDSLVLMAVHSGLRAGSYRFFAVVSFPGDESNTNDTSSTIVTVGYPTGSLLINEFMYAPPGDEPEWIELVNCSHDTIDLKNWRISDFNTAQRTPITTSTVLIPPGEFCVIAKDANFFLIHPLVHCPVVTTNFSALNNSTSDAIVLFEPRLTVIDSVYYLPVWGGHAGNSLERRDTEIASTAPDNWAQSEDSARSTPGEPNSVVRLPDDLSIKRCSLAFVQTAGGVVPEITIMIENAGKNTATSYSIRIIRDADRDTMFDSAELITELASVRPLGRSDSATYTFQWDSPPQGECLILASIEYPQDRRLKNNRASVILRTSYDRRSIIINEFMFDPLPGQNEWIELYNRSTQPVDLRGWTLTDRPTTSGSINAFTIADLSTVIRPGGFAVVAADSTLFELFPALLSTTEGCTVLVLNTPGGFGLNADGDAIILMDLTRNQIDSVSYSAGWHRPDITDTKGRTLERINPNLDSNSPNNWTTSVLAVGGTPGRSNSALTQSTPNGSRLSFSPNPFSPDGDGYEDFCLIQYHVPYVSAVLHVKIFDLKGRLVRTLANSLVSNARGEILWDGCNDERQRVGIGPYIVLVQAADAGGSASTAFKGVVVVATKL